VKAIVIANPRAGRGRIEKDLMPALGVLQACGWDVGLVLTSAPGDATRLAREAAEEGLDAVLAAGGDGTVNEIVQGLAGSDTSLGYLPYGTVNVWARELGLPTHPVTAAHAIVEGRMERVDLGLANGRHFLLMAGIGFDGEVVRRSRGIEHHKHRFGVLPYVAAGLSAVPGFRGADMELRYDGVIRRVQALLLIVGNTRLYGGRFRLTPNAVANDGWLDLCIVRGRGPLAVIRQSLPLILSGTISHSDVELLRVKTLSVRTEPPLSLQVDGELAGRTPVQFDIAPRALRAIIPKEFDSSLIA